MQDIPHENSGKYFNVAARMPVMRNRLVLGRDQKEGNALHPRCGRVSGRPGPIVAIFSPIARCNGMS